jgi:endonuclease YncB( thermonuclease family)
MIRARHAGLALALFTIVAFTISSSGYSSMEAERGVNIDVVNDEKANLGIADENMSTMGSNTTIFFTLTNQFGTRLTITVQATEKRDSMSVDVINSPYKLGQGNSVPVIATVDCSKPVNDAPVVVHITASNSNVRIMMNRTVQVSCTPKQEDSPSDTAPATNASNSSSVSSVDRESVHRVTITRVTDENTTIQTLTPTNTPTNTTSTAVNTTTSANIQPSITGTVPNTSKNTASPALSINERTVNRTTPTRVIDESEDILSPTPAPVSAPTPAPTAPTTQTDSHLLSPSDTLSPATPVNTSTPTNETTPISRPTEMTTIRIDTQTPPTTETDTPVGTRTDPSTPANTTTPSQILTSPTQVPTPTPPSTATNTQPQTAIPIQSSVVQSSTKTTASDNTSSSVDPVTAMDTGKSDRSPVSPIENGTARYATITRVIDGDTVKVKFEDRMDTIRLVGIDTPEAVAANVTPSEYGIPNSSRGRDWLRRWNENAQMFVENITTNRVLVVTDPTSETRDDAGRLLAYVYYGADQNTNLGRTLLERGLARQNDNVNYTLKNEYRQRELHAQAANRGLWAFETQTTSEQTGTKMSNQMRMTTHASSNASPLTPTSGNSTNSTPTSENTTRSTPIAMRPTRNRTVK